MSLIEDESLVLVMGANVVTRLTLGELEIDPSEDVRSQSLADLAMEMSRKTKLENLVPKWHAADVEQRMMAGAT